MSHPDPTYDEAELIEQNLDKLEEMFFKDYHGDKEHFEAGFERWLSDHENEIAELLK